MIIPSPYQDPSSKDGQHGAASGQNNNVLQGPYSDWRTSTVLCLSDTANDGVRSVHNIQYDYVNTTGILGYGHIDENRDCMGSWYVVGSELPFTVNLAPSIDEMSSERLLVGRQAVITLSGSNFENTANNVKYTSVVVLDNGIQTITLTPDTISASMITVTVPALEKGTYGLFALKDDIKSNKQSLVVVPQVLIDSAVISRGNVIITGTGFGDEPSDMYANLIGITIERPVKKKTAA